MTLSVQRMPPREHDLCQERTGSVLPVDARGSANLIAGADSNVGEKRAGLLSRQLGQYSGRGAFRGRRRDFDETLTFFASSPSRRRLHR
jgi:hypothetical protein